MRHATRAEIIIRKFNYIRKQKVKQSIDMHVMVMNMSNVEEFANELIQKIEARRDRYGSVLVKSAIVRNDDMWENYVTKVLPLHKSDSYILKERLHYCNFVLFEVIISLDELVDIVKKLPDKGTGVITLGDYEVAVSVNGLQKGDKYDSGREYLDVGWFFEKYQYRGQKSFYREPVVAKDLPLFPNFSTAIKEFVGIDLQRYSDLLGIVICLPYYGAKIQEVNIGSTEIRLKIETKGVASENVLGKLYCERGEERTHVDIELADGMGTASVGFKPDTLYVALLSKMNEEILDIREYHSSWERMSKGVVIDIPEYEIRELIRRGETETIEFKQKIGKPQEFAETFVAFANTKGGVILLGVDDHSKIVGFSEKGYEDTITNILRSHCIPQVKCEISEMRLNDDDIIVVRVEEGKDKPYFVREKGPYIRANATDRVATRHELDEIYSYRQSGYGMSIG